MYYDEIVRWLKSKKISFADQASKINKLKLKLRMKVMLRPYQEEAVQAWIQGQGRGSVCLPTGAGKSWVALKDMEQVS